MVSMSSQIVHTDEGRCCMITVQFDIHEQHNSYTILIDGAAFCTASNDDDGFKLMAAIAILEAKGALKNEKN